MYELERNTALEIFKDFSRAMYPSYNLFGEPELSISRKDFEKFRKKYLDDTKTIEEAAAVLDKEAKEG